MSSFFNTFLYQPILSTLVFIYTNVVFGDLGLAIIILSILLRVVFFPIFYKQAKHQAVMQKIQPKIKKIQKEFKEDKEKLVQEMTKLWKEHKVNPFSGLLLILVQLPFFIAIYKVILNEVASGLFDNFMFLGFIDLREKSLIIAAILALLQYYQAKMSISAGGSSTHQGEKDATATASRMMVFFAPIITLAIFSRLPSALGIFWLASSIFSIGQQFVVNKRIGIDESRIMNHESEVKEKEIETPNHNS